MRPVALSIAGSDPSGGAGIQADLKTFHQFGIYGEAVITLITVQNTLSVTRVEVLPADLVAQQLTAVLTDIVPHAAKSGALGSVENIEAVAGLAAGFKFPFVVDPVMVSKHGARLISEEAETVLVKRLLPLAALVTPNIPEAEFITGLRISTVADMQHAAKNLIARGARAVLIKGGHGDGEPTDVLYHGGTFDHFPGVRIDTRHTHGTGCTYSAAITAGLAAGFSLKDAVWRAKQFVQAAIETAPGLGHGFGPVNHFAGVY